MTTSQTFISERYLSNKLKLQLQLLGSQPPNFPVFIHYFKMSERSYNVAVIGYGLSSKVFMIPFILATPRLNLYAIVQRKPTNDNNAQVDHPAAKIYHGSNEMLEDPAIDVVIVATPPASHFTLCKQALEAGKNGMSFSSTSRLRMKRYTVLLTLPYYTVVCEKPFMMNTEEADKIVALAAEKKLVLTVFHSEYRIILRLRQL